MCVIPIQTFHVILSILFDLYISIPIIVNWLQHHKSAEMYLVTYIHRKGENIRKGTQYAYCVLTDQTEMLLHNKEIIFAYANEVEVNINIHTCNHMYRFSTLYGHMQECFLNTKGFTFGEKYLFYRISLSQIRLHIVESSLTHHCYQFMSLHRLIYLFVVAS